MFYFDSFHEILLIIRKNKLRTFLTGFSVAWGIFMLILFLAFGNGLKNGMMSNFAGRAQNAISVWPGRTSIGHAGLPTGREIKFTEKDIVFVTDYLSGAKNISPRIIKYTIISYGDQFGWWDIEGSTDNIAIINNLEIAAGNGRFLNQFDIEERRKVIVISQDMQKILFKKENPLGKYVIVSDVAYEVVGVYDKVNHYQENLPAYIPVTIAQSLYGGGNTYHRIDFLIEGLNTYEANEQFNSYLRKRFGQIHNFHPNDRSALFIRNTAQAAIQTLQILTLIDIFIVIVGIASLIAGIVGVGNIMLITVKERTKEIGIRKAIGAKPWSIIGLIIMESTFITGIAGYVGLLIGIGVTELASRGFAERPEGLAVFKDPSVDIGIVAGATALIIICGVIAGFIPALKAARIHPVEAMK